jgi:threonine/homoserine efflux transporter RhtA
LSGGSRIVNPVGIEGSTKLLDLFERGSFVLLVPVSAALILSFVVRFRRARGDERQQIKLVAYGVALFTLAILVVSIWPSIDRSVVGNVLFLVGFLAIPSAIALAILKYRLFNIDVVINRTLVYAVLTAALGIVYFGGVAALQLVTRPIPGDQSQLVVVVSTLAIAALFNPLRRRTQSVIDRRFYRRKYDAARTLEAFSARLRNDRDLGQLSAGLLSAVRETMEPAHVSLWLPPERAPRSGTGGR